MPEMPDMSGLVPDLPLDPGYSMTKITSLRVIPTMTFQDVYLDIHILLYIRTIYLTYILTFYLAFCLASYLTYVLAFYLAVYLT